jgi:hypothetical protein
MTTKKLNHFVARFYLKAWALDDQIWCLRDGSAFRTNVRNVAAENHFYRLKPLTQEDMEFVRQSVINDSPLRLRPMHERLLQQFARPHSARAKLQQDGETSDQVLAAVDRDIAEANENLHMSIETSFRPLLERLRGGDLDWLKDEEATVHFYHGLAVQYARTRHRRRIELLMPPFEQVRYDRVASVVSHMLATNLGYSLFNEHPQLAFHIVESPLEVPFVTTDQPVINVSAYFNDVNAPAKFEVYYPLSPHKALFIVGPDSEFAPESPKISATVSHLYNLRLASRAHKQIFASCESELIAIRRDLPAFLNSL